MRLTLADIKKIQDRREKLVMLTCYDASFAGLCDGAGVELLLIGDSLGMVIQGHDSTLPVTLEQTAYHVACVARGSQRGFIIADLPFGTYQGSPEQALRSSATVMAAGAQMVKLEGGVIMLDTIRFLVERGIPVCGHVGLTPQSVHQFGGYRVQGKGNTAERVLADARTVEEAGAAMVVLEAMPAELGTRISEVLQIPTIGIGAGVECDGQVLVLHDMLDIYPGRKARFVRNFMEGADSVADAIKRYVVAVKDGSFPGPEHSF
ncbi:MAG TPA: 3-methyl-2-oxobutanoate hydroxymethyltransferase [Burkholderiales bacterium]|jgi:3-methyl-2-oxobutanoate hydroxymethyltransferase|nr:3-methyl-2-oxobutanoate hydroxymethyltransferase [Burkholderiales bacterium]